MHGLLQFIGIANNLLYDYNANCLYYLFILVLTASILRRLRKEHHEIEMYKISAILLYKHFSRRCNGDCSLLLAFSAEYHFNDPKFGSNVTRFPVVESFLLAYLHFPIIYRNMHQTMDAASN